MGLVGRHALPPALLPLLLLRLLGGAAGSSCPALQGGFAGHGMVLERSGSRLFGVTPFERDVIVLRLSGAPGVQLHVAPDAAPSIDPRNHTSYRWRAMLPALPLGGSLNLTVSSTKGAAAGCHPSVYTDVTVGQLWLCSGQSNIAFGLGEVTNATRELPRSHEPWGAALRMFDGGWTKASDGGGNASLRWSAECFLFAKHLHLMDPDHPPIGLTTLCSGGTGLEYWIPPDSFVAHPTPASNGSVQPYFFGRVPQLPNGLPQPNVPGFRGGGGWNRSTSRLLYGPTTLTGVYWHQGEANTAPSACEVPDGAWLRSLSKAECLSSPEAGADGGEMGCKMTALFSIRRVASRSSFAPDKHHSLPLCRQRRDQRAEGCGKLPRYRCHLGCILLKTPRC